MILLLKVKKPGSGKAPRLGYASEGLTRRCDLLDFSVNVVIHSPVGHENLGHAALDHAERERVAGGVEAQGFPNATEADVFTLGSVEHTGLSKVEHLLLTDLDAVTTEEGFDVFVLDIPEDFDLQAGGRPIAGSPLLDFDLFRDGEVFASWAGNNLGVESFVDGHVEEGVWIE